MLSENEENLITKLTDGNLSSIFRVVYGFLPTDKIAGLGAYLRQLATKPREVLAEDVAIISSAISAGAAVGYIADPGSFDTISMADALKDSARQWTLVCNGIVSWTDAGNIAVAGTCPAKTSVTFTYLPSTEKWYPSKVA
jgi:hypothetical protein